MNGTSEWLALQAEVLDRIREIPGIRAAGWSTMNPISGRDRGAVIEVSGFTPRVESDKDIHLAAVTPEYFETLGIRLVGRDFTAADTHLASSIQFTMDIIKVLPEKPVFRDYLSRALARPAYKRAMEKDGELIKTLTPPPGMR